MAERQVADFALLTAAGLNLQAVFDLDALPATAAALRSAAPAGDWRQAILLGHGGRSLWDKVQAAGIASEHPIDDYSRQTFAAWFAGQLPQNRQTTLFPGDAPVGLQALGALAGWHHASPFMVGINAAWGTWFAYRVLALADTDLPPTSPWTAPSPCATCPGRPCVTACPADALAGGRFSLERCLTYRRQPASRCRATCVARLACPVRPEHRYEDSQLSHAYGRSLADIEAYSGSIRIP